MSIYQKAHLKQSIRLSPGLFLDDEKQSSIGAVEPDIFCVSPGRSQIGNQVVGIAMSDRPRIAEERKDFSALTKMEKTSSLKTQTEKKGFRYVE